MKIVIFAGGVGTRLWPLSRKNTPKQFGKIVGDKSTLQQTVERLLPEFKAEDIYISTNAKYKDVIQEQLSYIPKENFIYEPAMRDVGPAIGLATFLLEKKFPNEPIAILWSDHILKHEEKFRHDLVMAEEMIKKQTSTFVFIAQKARFANQNCGWIELGERVEHRNENDVYTFKRLRYRPALDEAQEFFKQENFVWNLGYFVTTPAFLTSLYKTFVPDMYQDLKKIADASEKPEADEVMNSLYPALEKISFDDAILEKLDPSQMFVISSDLGWSDVGTWDALKEALTSLQDDNITQGKVMLDGSIDTLLFNYTGQLAVGIDLKEIVIINTHDVLLICPKDSIPKIKKFVEKLDGTPHEDLA